MGAILTLGGFSGLNIRNAAKYPTVAEAIADTPVGGMLYFPSEDGPYIPPSASGWTIANPITIFSDGPGVGEDRGFQYYGSTLAAQKDSVIFSITPTAVRDVTFRGCVFSNDAGTPTAGGTGDAIRISGAGDFINLRIEDCRIFYAGRSALYSTTTNLVYLKMSGVKIFGCGGHGIYINAGHALSFDATISTGNQGMGMSLVDSGSGIAINGCDFTGNGGRLAANGASGSATLPHDYGIGYNAQLYLENCSGGSVSACNVENVATANPTHSKAGITLNVANGIVIGGNAINDGTAVAATEGIKMIGAVKGCTILGNRIGYMASAITFTDFSTQIGNTVFPQSITGDATGAGVVTLASQASNLNRNFIFASNVVTGVGDSKGVGIMLPQMSAEADIVAGVLAEGLTFYDNTTKTVKRRDNNSTDVVP